MERDTDSCWATFVASTESVGIALGSCMMIDDSLVTFAPLEGDVPGGRVVGSIEFRTGPMKLGKPIAVAGDPLFILGGNEPDIDTLRIVDVSAPEAPVVVGSLR